MEALRTIKKVINHQVLLELPDSFEDQQVEIIIFPVINRAAEELSALLLNGPVWSENQVDDFNETIKKGYRNWKITEF